MLSHFNLFSHPNKPLMKHLKEVGDNCRSTLSGKFLNLSELEMDIKQLSEVIYLVGITHDFGKATKYFQDYLNEPDKDKKLSLKSKDETKHGFLSAVFTYFVVKKFLQSKRLLDNKNYSMLPVLSFVIVKRHHGDLDDMLNEINEVHEKIFIDNAGGLKKILSLQVNSIEKNEIEYILKKLIEEPLGLEIHFDEFRNELVGIIKEIDHEYSKIQRFIRNIKTPVFYFITLLFYSILTDSDKSDAMDLPKIERTEIDSELLQKYITRFKQKVLEIDDIRNQIFDEVNMRIENLDLSQKIYSLNVPTGTGKTISSLSFALKLRNKIYHEKGYIPRIIYSLPFLSIIDQNFSVISEAYTKVTGISDISSTLFLKHHHLTEIFYKSKNEEFSIDESEFLIEGWNSEIIVTSFVQLFHSIFSNRNRALRKFHNIVNSIVILDEIQTIPHKYWLMLRETFNTLAKYFGTYFIVVTATEPLIFNERTGEIKSIVENNEKYFKALNRVKVFLGLNSTLSLNEFENTVLRDIQEHPNKDFLIVMNTIESSKEIYRFLEGKLNNGDNELFYLSTNIVPIERIKRIEEIKKSGPKRKIIVSTQLIEAGVDIDVDVIYRDLSPLDSINQVAGRCNRNNKKAGEMGEVHIYIVTNEKDSNRPFYSYIYDPFLISKTMDILSKYTEMSEKDFFELNSKYFNLVAESSSPDVSKESLEELCRLEFAQVGMFRLIKDEADYEKEDVFVEVDEKAENVWNRFCEIMDEKDFKKRKEAFLQIKNEFYSYVIAIPTKKVGNLPQIHDYRYLSRDEIEKKYDPKTGFIPGGYTLVI